MEKPEHILIRGVNWLGDAIMTSPAIERVRERFPQARITLLTHQKLASLWTNHPAIHEVIPFTDDEGVWRVSAKLRGREFTRALVLPNSPRSALECFLGRIPNRLGYARGGRNWLLSQAVPIRPEARKMHKRTPAEVEELIRQPDKPRDTFPREAHHTLDYLHLVSAWGCDATPIAPRLHVTTSELADFQSKWLPAMGPDDLVFGLNAGAEYGPAKRWPEESFIAAALQIQKQRQNHWIIFGGKADVGLAGRIEQAIRPVSAEARRQVVNVAGQTSLRELCVGLKRCRVLLTNDTGPMHVAAAVGCRVVVPFGSTSPELTGPGLPGETGHQLILGHAPCAPCFLKECPIDFRCMKSITIERVTQAFDAFP